MEQINSDNSNKPSKIWMWLVIIAIPVGILAYMAMNKPVVSPEPEIAVTNKTVIDDEFLIPLDEQPTTSTQEPAVMTASYKNGTYSSVGEYTSPGGTEQVGVSVTLQDDIITEVTFEAKAERPASVKFQGIFAGDYKQFVVGKKIDEVQLSKVSGSSLTPKGFNDALAKIKAQAKS
ncbi:FMN-binding protein [Candidatus Falkowbacteria bacterium]|nr:MAG: FMN-binding protein [Candidatus Falkowbacteria bacterium]